MKKKFEIKDKKAALMWVFEIAVVLLLAAVVSIFFCQSVVMQEGSMEPTLKTGQEFLINKVSYKLGEPKRGDIIVFKKDAKEHSSLHIKRIVGLPGEKIQIKDGVLYIDGKAYKEEYPQISNPGLAEQQITLGKNEYFVLGDNRNNSEDSRFAEVGNVKLKYIEGKLWLRIHPLKELALIAG
ncbi:MAG: signal peptidase I [Firmicutes bacterium]|nr:signal peptidase I [Bacillota bacterium]MDY3714932.1 signal peptidase I [Blautia sp.]